MKFLLILCSPAKIGRDYSASIKTSFQEAVKSGLKIIVFENQSHLKLVGKSHEETSFYTLKLPVEEENEPTNVIEALNPDDKHLCVGTQWWERLSRRRPLALHQRTQLDTKTVSFNQNKKTNQRST